MLHNTSKITILTQTKNNATTGSTAFVEQNQPFLEGGGPANRLFLAVVVKKALSRIKLKTLHMGTR